jgi:hypothetical protein
MDSTRKEYFREHVKSRYHADNDKAKVNKKTYRLIHQGWLDPGDYEQFGIYSSDANNASAERDHFSRPPRVFLVLSRFNF